MIEPARALRRARDWLRQRILGSAARFVYGERYGLELPHGDFDHRRADRILAFLLNERLIERRHVHRVGPCSLRALRRVHTDDYLEALQLRGALVGILGFDVSDEQHDGYLLAHREQTAGTCLAARLALASGSVAVNLGGGFHHALHARGQGFCVFNDVAVAIAERRAAGFSDRVLVIDLDLHDGDGTRAIFARDSGVHTFSIHNHHLGGIDVPFSTSVALGEQVDDRTYLDGLHAHLAPLLESTRPGLAFYLAGCDPAWDDALGNWRIGAEALLRRDRFVLDRLRAGSFEPTPTVVLLAGGYGQQAWRYSARFLSTLTRGGAAVEPPHTAELTLAHYRRIARLLGPTELTREPVSSESWQLSAEELDPAPSGRPRATRFLDYYSRHGVELALERIGLLEEIRRRGHETLHVELDLDSPGEHTMRVLSAAFPGDSLLELRVRRDERTVLGMSLLAVEWLLLQDPAASFTSTRPRLPGQRFPGLGLLREVAAALVLVCERLELDGLVFVPSHYHIAAQTGSYFHFLDPEAQARFIKLRQALRSLRLVEAFRAIEERRVRYRADNRPFRWQPAAMVLAVSERLKRVLDGETYRERVARSEDEFDFQVLPGL